MYFFGEGGTQEFQRLEITYARRNIWLHCFGTSLILMRIAKLFLFILLYGKCT